MRKHETNRHKKTLPDFKNKEVIVDSCAVWEMLCNRITKDFTANGFQSHIESFKEHFKPIFDIFNSESFSITVTSKSGEDLDLLKQSLDDLLVRYKTHIAKLLIERYDREVEFYCLKYLSDG